ncbi:hypothetical protein Tco_0519116 [Tanacetum coccineum]
MEISIADQIALDDALVAPTDRLKIGKCNLRLSSDVTSKEATLQVAYDVLKLTPFYKAFQVSADVPEIYMQEFWATAYVHNRSVRFKMNNKKHILNLDQFRDILQICPKVGNKKFEEPPLEKEILAFLASLGHSGEIRKITDVNVNKLHQPWRSFAAIINKCLSGKPSYDSLRLSQAQILWGMYNKKNVDYAYLLWEDFIFQIENKNTKKGNANDPMFTTINVISRNEDTQLYGTILPVALTNEDIRNSESYKEYYAIASGTIPPKTKGSKKKAATDTTTKQKPPTVPKQKKEKESGKGKQKTTELETISEAVLTEAEQLKIITKRSRKETHSSHASGSGADEGTGVTPGIKMMIRAQDDEDEDKHDVNETTQDDEDDDVHDDDENAQDDDDEEQTESEDDGDDFIHPKLTKTHDDEIIHEEETDEDKFFSIPTVQATQEIEDTHVTLTPVNPDGQQQSSSVSSGFVSNMLNPNQDTGVDDIFEQHAEATSLTDTPVTAIATTPSSSLQNLPNFASLFGFDYRLKSLEDNFSELRQTNQYAEALSSIPGIVDQYLANKMQEAVDVAVQLKYDRIREESNTENQQFLDSIDEGMKKLYKALVDAYEADKILLDTYGDTVTIKRPRDGADDDQEPSAGTDRGSKRRRSRKEPASFHALRETTTTTAGEKKDYYNREKKMSNIFLTGFLNNYMTTCAPDHAWNKSVPAIHDRPNLG